MWPLSLRGGGGGKALVTGLLREDFFAASFNYLRPKNGGNSSSNYV